MSTVETAVKTLLPRVSAVVDRRSVSGGCISDAYRVSVVFDDDRRSDLFVKSNHAAFADNFQCEADGLARLAEPDVIGVPRPLAVGAVGTGSFLITEWIDQGSRSEAFFADFGKRLADLHRATLGNQIGLDRDNYLGSARQINSPASSWNQFVATARIGFQIRWATEQYLADAQLERQCQKIIDSIDSILDGRDDHTSLLHGDLWSGNYLCDSGGKPFIIDPAAYYGCREAELGMLKLFGGCPASFYEAYHDRFPLADGWQNRTSVYVLYHLLNHLNLFGGGYLSQCRSVAAEILAYH